LSAERASAVVEYLKTRGVPARRLVATGWGSEWPLVSGRTAAALAQNRRIEFKLDAR
jgi:chemotaxis protein MotB